MYFIESERLTLIPLTNAQLLLLSQNRCLLEKQIGLNPSSMTMAPEFICEIEDALINFWIPKTKQNPSKYRWFTNWEIIDKSKNMVIGGMGFIGYPNELGETEMGYCFDSKVHNKGFGTEAIVALTRWAFKNKKTKTIRVLTGVTNFASQKMLEKAGFKIDSEMVNGYLVYRLTHFSS